MATGTCDRLGLGRQISQNKPLPLTNCIRRLCSMGRWSFWSWFDVNRTTFGEDISRKRFLQLFLYNIFVPSDLDLWFFFTPQICSPSYSYTALFPLNYKFLRLSYLEKVSGTGRTDGRSDRQTDGVQHLMRHLSEGRIVNHWAGYHKIIPWQRHSWLAEGLDVGLVCHPHWPDLHVGRSQ